MLVIDSLFSYRSKEWMTKNQNAKDNRQEEINFCITQINFLLSTKKSGNKTDQ